MKQEKYWIHFHLVFFQFMVFQLKSAITGIITPEFSFEQDLLDLRALPGKPNDNQSNKNSVF